MKFHYVLIEFQLYRHQSRILLLLHDLVVLDLRYLLCIAADELREGIRSLLLSAGYYHDKTADAIAVLRQYMVYKVVGI